MPIGKNKQMIYLATSSLHVGRPPGCLLTASEAPTFHTYSKILQAINTWSILASSPVNLSFNLFDK